MLIGMIEFSCPGCLKKLRVKDELAGRSVKCPGCGKPVAIPPTAPSTSVGGSVVSRPGTDETRDFQPFHFLAPPEASDEIGRLGGYRVLKLLGQGGMGAVFLAEDVHLKRKVALKTMLPAIAADAVAKARFLREAQSAAAIEHEHIIAIYQVSEDRGVPFLAMPFLKGQPLDELLKECKSAGKTLTAADAVRIAREIAEGLSAAHDHRMIHRDIKPGNVWLETKKKDEGGRMKDEKDTAMPSPHSSFRLPPSSFRVKILDFGLARAGSDTSHLTQSGAIVGTPAYMAPEQARGASVDGRADLFSLGCILYEMLTGKRPFTGNDTMAILSSLALDTPAAPRDVDPGLPAALSEITMALLQKEPGDRPATAADVVAMLREIETDLGAPATNPAMRPAAVTGIRTKSPAPIAKQNSLTEPDRRRRRGVRRSVVALVGVILIAPIVAVGGYRLLLKDAAGPIDIGSEKKEPDPKPLDVGSPPKNPSKNPSKVASGAIVRRLRFEQKLFDRVSGISPLSISPDGTTLVAAGSNNPAAIRLVDAATGKDLDQYRNLAVALRGVIAPDGHFLAAVGNVQKGGRLNEWDLRSKEAVDTKESRGGTHTVAYSPDGKWLVWGDANDDRATLRWRDRRTGKDVDPPLDVGGYYTNCATFSPDGSLLAVTAHGGQLTVLKTADRSVVFSARCPPSPPAAVFSPDGTTIVSQHKTGENFTVTLFNVADLGKVNKLVPMPGPGRAGSYINDGTIVPWYGGDGVIHFFDAKTWKQRDSFKAHNDAILGSVISPDGLTLATLDRSGTLKVWELAGSQ